jgi:ACS family glucarate transporter-like MFS transporter
MVEHYGWRETFYILGAVGAVWAVFWLAWFRDDPANHPLISPSERELILNTRQQAVHAGGDAGRLTLGAVLGSTNMWLLMGQYFASNFTFFFCLTWLFPHLKRTYELSDTETGLYAMWPLLGGMAGQWVGGAAVDALFRAGWWRWSRVLPAVAGFTLSAVGLLASIVIEPLPIHLMAACLTVAVFGSDTTISASWSVCVDIGRRNAGTISGIMNMAGNLGSFVTGLAFPYFAQWSNSTRLFFVTGAVLNLCAAAAWLFVRPERPLETEP